MNKDHVAIVFGQDSREINEFVKRILVERGETLDLSNAELSGLKLTNIDFRNANLQGTDFSGSTFDTVNFLGAKMQGAYLRHCTINKCIFLNSRLMGAEFHETTIQDSKMMKADLSSSIFWNAMLKQVYLNEAIFDNKTSFEMADMEKVWISTAKVNGSSFTACHARDCFFNGTIFDKVNLTNFHAGNCNFEGTKFLNNTKMEHAQFSNCRMPGSKFDHVNGRSCDFTDSCMTDAKLIESDFFGANFSGTDLRNADLSGSKFDYARFPNAVMKRIRLDSETSLKEVVLNGCQLSVHSDIPLKTAREVLAKGIVHNASFVRPVFGRKIRDEAWLNDWKKDIDDRKPLEYGGVFKFMNFCPSFLRRPLSYFGMRFLQLLWWLFSDYGRSIWRWIGWSVLLSILFAFIFFWLGPQHFTINPDIVSNHLRGRFQYAYYSIVTFTTLGFGDITPKTSVAMAVVMSEVVVGYVMLGGLISILANKLARRND